MSKTIIEVNNVSKTFDIPHEKVDNLRDGLFNIMKLKKRSYEKFYALTDVSFKVQKGEFLGIIGKNGSGKSTLLKILSKIYTPDQGRVVIDGKISPFLELGVGFNGELSARDNIYLNGSILGLSKQNIDEKFDKIVEFAELKNFIDTKVKNYSSGMYARLAFSVAIEAEADIYIMDEVLAVGDYKFQNKCLKIFNNFQTLGKTIILVSHDINLISKRCSRSILLDVGEILSKGHPEKITRKYISLLNKENGTNIENNTKTTKTHTNNSSIKITKFDFLNDQNNPVTKINTNDNLKVRVSFINHTKPKKLNFGISMFNQDNSCVHGTNTIIDKIKYQKEDNRNYFEITYNSLPLRTGNYYFKAGIFGSNDRIVHDFKVSSKMIGIDSSNKKHGIIDLQYVWK